MTFAIRGEMELRQPRQFVAVTVLGFPIYSSRSCAARPARALAASAGSSAPDTPRRHLPLTDSELCGSFLRNRNSVHRLIVIITNHQKSSGAVEEGSCIP